jgi:hypothetical protein
VICSHLDLPGRRAIARVLRPFRPPAARELQEKVMEVIARTESTTGTKRILRWLESLDSTLAAKHAPMMLQLMLEHPDQKVRPERAPLHHR